MLFSLTNHTNILRYLFLICLIQTITPLYADTNNLERETISGITTAKNNFSWHHQYDIEVKNKVVYVFLTINLINAPGVSKVLLVSTSKKWKDGAESIWNNKYALQSSSGDTYPIHIVLSFKGTNYQHEVIVRPGAGASDQLNWNIFDSPEIVAHEIGHMLGLYDEYTTGSLNPVSNNIDPTSIMFNDPGNASTKQHHYEPFRIWLEKKLSDNVSLIKMTPPQ